MTTTTRRRHRGQSLVEFAIILPLLLAFLGATVDFARLYQAWVTLQSATRDAAEYAATSATTATQAGTDAQRVVCLATQGLAGFQPGGGGNPATCTSPAVSVVSYDRSTTAPGATTRFPVATVRIRATFDFRMLFNYPFLTRDGSWTITADQSYSISQGRVNP